MIYKYNSILPNIGKNVYVASSANVIGMVTLGEHASVWHNAVIRGDEAQITIGSNTNIQDCSVLHCTPEKELVIGDGTTIGHSVVLHSCTIGSNTLIGMGAIVLDDVVIGDNCFIAAGSLITPRTIIEDGSMVMGSPAKVKRKLTEEEVEKIIENAKDYYRLKEKYIAEENSK